MVILNSNGWTLRNRYHGRWLDIFCLFLFSICFVDILCSSDQNKCLIWLRKVFLPKYFFSMIVIFEWITKKQFHICKMYLDKYRLHRIIAKKVESKWNFIIILIKWYTGEEFNHARHILLLWEGQANLFVRNKTFRLFPGVIVFFLEIVKNLYLRMSPSLLWVNLAGVYLYL